MSGYVYMPYFEVVQNLKKGEKFFYYFDSSRKVYDVRLAKDENNFYLSENLKEFSQYTNQLEEVNPAVRNYK